MTPGDLLNIALPQNFHLLTTKKAISENGNKTNCNKMAHFVKNLPAMQETWVRSLSWDDPLEKEMTTHSSTLAWRIPPTEEPGRLQSMGSLRVRHDCVTNFHLGFPGGSDGKASVCNAGDPGWEDPLEKEMAAHSSTIAWKIPWREEPCRL